MQHYAKSRQVVVPLVGAAVAGLVVLGGLASCDALAGVAGAERAQPLPAQEALPLPEVVVFDIDLTADAVPSRHLEEPRGIAFAGGVVVADAARHHLVNLDTLAIIGREGSGDGEFSRPHALAAGDALYVADTGNHRIQKIDHDGQFAGAWGHEGAAPGELRAPEGVAVAPDGSLLVADTGNGRVQRFDASGQLIAAWSETFVRPTALAVATDSAVVFVADAGAGTVSRYTLEGAPLGNFAAGETPAGADLVATTHGPVNTGAPPSAVERSLVWVGSSDTGQVVAFDADGNRLSGMAQEGLKALGPSAGAEALGAGSQPGQGLNGYAVAEVLSLPPTGEPVQLWGDARGPQRHYATSAVAAEDGTILVASLDPPSVLLYQPDGHPAGSWGSPAWRSADPNTSCAGPSSIDTAPDGTVWVANVCAATLERWTRAGSLVAAWPLVADGKVAEVTAVAGLPDGGAVVADAAADELVVFAPDGAVRRRMGGPGAAEGQLQLFTWLEDSLAGPGLDADATGRIFVSDAGNGRVQIFNATGGVAGVIDPATGRDAPTRYLPGPLRVAPDGSFYLADGTYDTTFVQRFAPDGTLLAVLVARCADIADAYGCIGSFNDDPDDPHARPVLAAGAEGLVAVTHDALTWYRPDGKWLRRLRDTYPTDGPAAGLPPSLSVGPAGDALVAAEWLGVRDISAEGTVRGRWRNAVAPADIISTAYRAVPLWDPISAARTASGNAIVVEQFGRVALLDARGDLLRLLAPMTQNPSGNRAALRGTDGRTYVQVAQPPLTEQGFLVYDDDGNLVDTLVTNLDGFDVALAPDRTAYYVTFDEDPDVVASPPGGDVLAMRWMDLGDGQAVSIAVDTVTTPPGLDHVLWVADRSGHLVRALPDGQILDRWDGAAVGYGPVMPTSVRVGPDGSLWVLHAEGTRLRKYTYGQPPGWRVTYRAADDLEGAALGDERVPEVVLDWGADPPSPALTPGRWAARAERWLQLPPGPQTVHVTATGGGVRLRWGGALFLDRSAAAGIDEDVVVPGGFAQVEVDYVHHDGAASLRLGLPSEIPGAAPTLTPGVPPATATPEAPATATRRVYDNRTIYLPLVRRDMDPPFVDDFSDPTSGWPVADTPTTLMAYADGEYRIVNRTADQGATVYSDLHRRTLDVQIDVRPGSDKRGTQGLVFAADVTSLDPFTVKSEFVFIVQPDIQQWGLFSCTNRCGRVQTGTVRSIPKDGPNTLRVTWEKKWLRVYLNGDRMWQRMQGDYKPELYHGLTAGPVDAGFDSRFDNYTVREEYVPPPRSARELRPALRQPVYAQSAWKPAEVRSLLAERTAQP